MKNSYEEQFITEFCNKIKTQGCSKNTIAEQVFDAGYRLAVPARVNSNDGWIDWDGGECPITPSALVDIMLQDGEEYSGMPAEEWRWEHLGHRSDIIKYRLHQQQDANTRANDDRLAQHAAAHAGFASTSRDEETDLNDCIGQTPEDITLLTHFMLDEIRDAEINIRLDDAYELAQHLISVGYRKQ